MRHIINIETMQKNKETALAIPNEIILNKIYFIRGHKVMLDSDLAELYQVETKVLKQSVKRNMDIFPEHFMFELTEKEFNSLRSQFVTSNRGGRRYLPYVFTEQGVAMLSSVLKSKQAIQINILIMRTFVKIRNLVYSYKDLADKIATIEKSLGSHGKKIIKIFEILNCLTKENVGERKEIGFKA